MSSESQSGPWYVKVTSQMGPVIAAFFFFLWLVSKLIFGPIETIPQQFSSMREDHDDILHETQLSNHFLWANCVNAAETNEERSRCIPPVKKVKDSHELNMYSFPSVAQNAQTSGSSSLSNSSLDHINTREAAQQASIQNQARLDKLHAL